MSRYLLILSTLFAFFFILIIMWFDSGGHHIKRLTMGLINHYSNSSVWNPARNYSKIIVISRWREDISWIDLYVGDIDHVVYNKEDMLASHNVPNNKAQEATCYLRYIIDYWGKFPEIVVFLHAHRFAWHQQGPDDMVSGLKSLQWGKYDYMPLQTSMLTHSWFRERDNNLQYAFNHFLWEQVLSELGPPPEIIVCPCCAAFAIKREAILRRSKSFYENIYNFLQATNITNFISSRTMEYTWHIIFGQPHVRKRFDMCDVFHCNSSFLRNHTNASKIVM